MTSHSDLSLLPFTSMPIAQRVRKLVSALMLGLSLVVGLLVSGATPAQAAISYGSVSACFTTSYSYPVGGIGTGPLTGTWAEVQYAWNGQWVSWGNKVWIPNGSNGCVAASVQTGYYWRMRVYEITRNNTVTKLEGATNYAGVVYAQNYYLGTAFVARTSIR
jgi:hypothetical protein